MSCRRTRLVLGLGLLLPGCSQQLDPRLPPHRVEVVAGDNQSRAVGMPVTVRPSVRVVDQYGWPIPGVPVTFASLATARVTPALVLTDARGIATVDRWELRRDGGSDSLVVRAPDMEPVAIHASAAAFVELTVVNGSSCGLLNSGRVLCWGDFPRTLRSAAESIPPLHPTYVDTARFQSLAAGTGRTCGLQPSGTLWCLTAGGDNRFHEVGGGQRYLSVAMAGFTPCVLAADSLAKCLRVSDSGPPTVQELPGSHPSRSISANLTPDPFNSFANAACALEWDGHARCWTLVFQNVERSWLGGVYDTVAAGAYGACGLRGGVVECGGLFASTLQGIIPVPRATGIAAAGGRKCGLTGQGVYCWGATPLLVPGTEQLGLVQLSISDDHACGRDRRGLAWCWGNNSAAQLGDGTRISRDTPVPVKTDY